MIDSPGNSPDSSIETPKPIDPTKPIDPEKSIGPTRPIAAEQPSLAESKPDASHTLKVVRFETLACCGDEIWIENEGQIYRLRRTRQGKLILTK